MGNIFTPDNFKEHSTFSIRKNYAIGCGGDRFTVCLCGKNPELTCVGFNTQLMLQAVVLYKASVLSTELILT